MNIKSALQNLGSSISKHSPEILIGIGIGGTITSSIMLVKATPKAMILMEEIDTSIPKENKKARAREIVKKVGPVYAPGILVEAASIGCIVAGTSVNLRRNALLSAAYSLSEATLKEYQHAVIQEVGEKKEKEIRNNIIQDKIDANPIGDAEVDILKGKGTTLCYDVMGERYFMSDYESLREIKNDLNERLLREMYLEQNDIYDEMNLRRLKTVENIRYDVDDGLLVMDTDPMFAENKQACLAVSFHSERKFPYGDM